LNCLQQNAAGVSTPCRQALSAIGGSAAHAGQSAPPSGANGTAPADSSAPSSAQATSAPPLSRRQRAYILRQACGMDFQQNCHGVPLGGGHAIECLASHRDTLSPRCQGALASARQ
jgi:Cysteine rich repeat